MLKSKLRAVGGSVMFAIPKSILESLGLKPNSEVGVTVSDGRLIVEPAPRRRYSLDELLAQSDPGMNLSEDDKAWLADAPKGREAI